MSYRKIVMLAILPLVFCATNTFSNTLQTQEFRLNASIPWKIPFKAITLQLSAKVDSKVDWFVNSEVVTRKGETFPADTVHMDCDGKMFIIPANSHQVCELKTGHVMRVFIAPEDYSHGSAGTWQAGL